MKTSYNYNQLFSDLSDTLDIIPRVLSRYPELGGEVDKWSISISESLDLLTKLEPISVLLDFSVERVMVKDLEEVLLLASAKTSVSVVMKHTDTTTGAQSISKYLAMEQILPMLIPNIVEELTDSLESIIAKLSNFSKVAIGVIPDMGSNNDE